LLIDSARQYGLITGGPKADVERCIEILEKGSGSGTNPANRLERTMGKTSIEWTDFTVNPIRARLGDRVGHYCEKISAGCKNCYASRIQKRFGMPEFAERREKSDVRIWFDPHKLHEVTGRKKPTRFFWCDMTDMFGHWIPAGWIDECFKTMAYTPQHIHQILTKRPERMARIVPEIRSHYPDRLENVHLGVSVEDQATLMERWNHLRYCQAAVYWISYEPALGPIVLPKGFLDLGKRAWLVCGGESGPKARPMHPDWPRAVRDQCVAAGVPFFFKQWGEWAPFKQKSEDDLESGDYWLSVGGMNKVYPSRGRNQRASGALVPRKCMAHEAHRLTDGKWMVRVGKKRAGRLLDGRVWDEFPEARQ
jgi:protein gp37